MSLRRTFPMVRADYIRVPGTTWVEDPDTRFETIDMRGPMILLVNRIFNAIVDDLPRQFSLAEGETQATTQIKIPEKALREAIVNALIHRSYRVNRPLQIIRYSNRIEIINPGYSLKPEESLGEPGSNLRNQMISAIFHDTNLAETKGSGMKSMRLLMNKAKILPPTYESNHGKNQFTLRVLLHQLFGAEDMDWINNFRSYFLTTAQTIAVVFLREVGAIDLLTYRQLTGLKPSGARADLGKLMNAGIILPKGRGNKTYYVPSEKAIKGFSTTAVDTKSESQPTHNVKDNTPSANDNTPSTKDNTPSLNDNTSSANDNTSSVFVLNLHDLLRSKIVNLKKKEQLSYLRSIVEEICSLQPMSLDELTGLLKRDRIYLWRNIINPLKKEGKLSFTHPEMKNHPDQKYRIGLNSQYYNEKREST